MDDLLVLASLTLNEEKIDWIMTDTPIERPTPQTPERPELAIPIGDYSFHLSRDPSTATLTKAHESPESMICCNGLLPSC